MENYRLILLTAGPLMGALSSFILGVISFFIVKTYNTIEKNFEKHSAAINSITQEQTKATLELSGAIRELGSNVKQVEARFLDVTANTERTLREHHDEIASLRATRAPAVIRGQIKVSRKTAVKPQ